MKVLIQWSLADPEDWEEVDSADWATLPSKPEPIGGEVLDNTKGWINKMNIQGMIFSEDHFHVEDIPSDGSCKITTWNDDPEDWEEGTYLAEIWHIKKIGPDPIRNGMINTFQSKVSYRGPNLPQRPIAVNEVRYDWADFVAPTTNISHGIWLTEEKLSEHKTVASIRGYADAIWNDHLPTELLESNGKLKIQNPKLFMPFLTTIEEQ